MQFKHIISLLLMYTLAVYMMSADEPFNPADPPEPSAAYKLKMRTEPEGVGYVSGAGLYRAGTGVYLNTSGNSIDYRFKRWLIDGEEYYDTWDCIYYYMPQHDVEVVAEYEFVEFNPDSPSDPASRYMRRIYVESQPAGVCSFNISSGERFEQGSEVYLQAMPNQGYVFDGWYIGSKKVSDSTGFDFTVPESNTTLSAHFTYNPENPTDPTGSQTDVDNSGFVEATGITIDATTLSLSVPSTHQLKASILPANATYKNIYWFSSNTSVAKVNQSGEVVGVSPGTAIITATNGKFTVTCTVTVSRDFLPGDVNGDGIVTISDVTLIMSHIIGITTNGMNTDAADLNGDGKITISDVTQVVNILLDK